MLLTGIACAGIGAGGLCGQRHLGRTDPKPPSVRCFPGGSIVNVALVLAL
ncbi:MAG: hypothetical protein FWF31_09325 [Desulfobulbus sp.]|nr:hypothetical protein [Desulfobulbus sp.]